MLVALLRKDLREARATLLAFVPVLAVLSAITAWHASRQAIETSPLQALRPLALLAIIAAGFALSHVVVAREMSGRTQLFVEALPVPPPLLFLSKLVVVVGGGAAVAAAAVAGFAFVDVADGVRSAMFVRLLVFSLFLTSFCFALGFLGRYRTPLALLLITLAIVIESAKQLELFKRGPFALLDERLAVDPGVSGVDVMWALGFAGAFLAAAAVVAHTRERDLPARFAEKMSQREKVFFTLLIFGTVTTALGLDAKKPKQKYVLAEAATVERDGVDVAVGTGFDAGDAERELAASVHAGLVDARAIVPLTLPRVTVVSALDMPAGLVEEGHFDKADGVLLRTGPSRDPVHHERVLARAVVLAVKRATRNRAFREDRAFALDALGLYAAARTGTNDDHLRRLSLAAAPAGPRAEELARWYAFREHAGVDGAAAHAYVGLRALEELAGRERTRAFLARILAIDAPEDFRAILHTHDVDDALRDTCALDRAAWLAAWQRTHDADRARLGAPPRFDGVAALEPLSDRTVRVRVKLADGAVAAPAAGPVVDARSPRIEDEARIEVQRVSLPFSREPLNEDQAVREEVAAADLRGDGVALFSAARGHRFAWRLVLVGDDGSRTPTPWRRVEVAAP